MSLPSLPYIIIYGYLHILQSHVWGTEHITHWDQLSFKGQEVSTSPNSTYIVFSKNTCAVVWPVEVSDSHSCPPPCRCTASAPRSRHRRSRAGWWRRACPAHSTACRCPSSASGRWWWTEPWRGWSASCSDPGGTGRSLCSGTRCNPWERRSSPTSRSPRSPRRAAGVGRTWTDPPPRCSPGSGRCGRAGLSWGRGAGWGSLGYRLNLEEERKTLC